MRLDMADCFQSVIIIVIITSLVYVINTYRQTCSSVHDCNYKNKLLVSDWQYIDLTINAVAKHQRSASSPIRTNTKYEYFTVVHAIRSKND